MEHYSTFFSSTYDDPVINELKSIKKELEGIKHAVATKIDTRANKKARNRFLKYK